MVTNFKEFWVKGYFEEENIPVLNDLPVLRVFEADGKRNIVLEMQGYY